MSIRYLYLAPDERSPYGFETNDRNGGAAYFKCPRCGGEYDGDTTICADCRKGRSAISRISSALLEIFGWIAAVVATLSFRGIRR